MEGDWSYSFWPQDISKLAGIEATSSFYVTFWQKRIEASLGFVLYLDSL